MIRCQNELYHHGILGMKWGVRRYRNKDGSLTSAGKKRYDVGEQKARMKSAKKESKQAYKDYRKKLGIGIGIDRIQRSANAEKKAEKAALKYIDEKAKYKGVKSKNYDKAEFNSYRKTMQKYGIRGSYNDRASNNSATKLYDHIATKKGKAYADRIEKSVQNRAYASLAASGAVAIGTTFASAYLASRG